MEETYLPILILMLFAIGIAGLIAKQRGWKIPA